MLKNIRTLILKWKFGKAYVNQKYRKAIEIGKEYLSRKPEDIEMLVTVAECFFYVDDPKTAIKYAKQGLSLDQHNFDVLRILVNSYNADEEYAEAYRYASLLLSDLSKYFPSPDRVTRDSLKDFGPLSRKLDDVYSDMDKERHEFVDWAQKFKAWYEKQDKTSANAGSDFGEKPN